MPFFVFFNARKEGNCYNKITEKYVSILDKKGESTYDRIFDFKRCCIRIGSYGSKGVSTKAATNCAD